MIIHILGGGAGQLSAINSCRRLGITTFVTDQNPNAPGCMLADYSAAASTFDAEQTVLAARELERRTGLAVNALLVTGTDQPVLTAAKTAEALGIPYFLDTEQAELVTNKKIMKNGLSAAGIPTAPFRFVSPGFRDEELDGLGFPVVVKPLDSQGQRGVFRLETVSEVRSCISEVLGYSRCGEILVEEYLPSGEVTLSGWLIDGKLYILSVTDRVTIENPPSIGVCIAHHYPSKYCNRMPEIRRLTERIVRAFRLENGPLYFQYLIASGDAPEAGGTIIVNETACRLGGAYEDQFIPFITGVNILDVMIEFSCGNDYNEADLIAKTSGDLHPGRVVSLQMFFCSEGIIDSQSGMEQVLRHPDVIGGAFLQKPGTVIHNRLNSTQRAGYFIVCCSSETEADKVVQQAYSILRIEDENGANMIQFYDKMLFGGNK